MVSFHLFPGHLPFIFSLFSLSSVPLTPHEKPNSASLLHFPQNFGKKKWPKEQFHRGESSSLQFSGNTHSAGAIPACSLGPIINSMFQGTAQPRAEL